MVSMVDRANELAGRVLTRLGMALSHPAAFGVALLYMVLWSIAEPDTLDMHGAITLGALFMTLFIQRATHRDTQALHAKLDELLWAEQHARNELTSVDEDEPEQIEERRHAEKSARDTAKKS